MTRFTTLALSLSVAALLSACGLKGDLYLPAKPVATPGAAAPAAAAPKAGDDSKATDAAPATK